MFDKDYFYSELPRDVEAAGGHPVVEVQLVSGHSHRVRSVIDVTERFVTLETYLAKGDLAHERPRFGEKDGDGGPRDVYRAVIAYESIAAVIFDPSVSQTRVRTGFVNS